jgi:hypothetical protein
MTIWIHHDDEPLPRNAKKGYAVKLGIPISEVSGSFWTFFEYLEPALAFGRAGRTAWGVSSYGVWRAAIRPDAERGGYVHLYVDWSADYDRGPEERELLERWVAHINPDSAHWYAPSHRPAPRPGQRGRARP